MEYAFLDKAKQRNRVDGGEASQFAELPCSWLQEDPSWVAGDTASNVDRGWTDLPDFYNPFPSRFNPNHDSAWEKARRWICSIGLVRGEMAASRMDKGKYSELAARVYPDADAADLERAMFWLSWLFLADDQLDECHLGRQMEDGRKMIEGMLSLAESPALSPKKPANALEASWLDFWEKVSPTMSFRLQQRFLRHVRAYMQSLLWEIENRASGRTPDFLAYVEARRDTGAMGTVFDFIEYAAHAELPTRVCESSSMDTLRKTAIDVVCMTNDILSYNKEVARGETTNYVVISQQLMDGSVRDAMYLVNELQSSRVRLFLDTKMKLTNSFDHWRLSEDERKASLTYVEGMQHWMRGNLDFTLASPRYFDVEATKPDEPVSWIENICAMPESAFVAPMGRV